ncbi:MAG: hypothetical protein JNM63_15325 [Spirochaetia bacterium]|nr:hypothetical protein [Spirochaetia bacterium]
MNNRPCSILIDPIQTTPCVFGLRGPRSGFPCFIDREDSLSMMDAPEMMPAGSMIQVSYCNGIQIILESHINRDNCHDSTHH